VIGPAVVYDEAREEGRVRERPFSLFPHCRPSAVKCPARDPRLARAERRASTHATRMWTCRETAVATDMRISAASHSHLSPSASLSPAREMGLFATPLGSSGRANQRGIVGNRRRKWVNEIKARREQGALASLAAEDALSTRVLSASAKAQCDTSGGEIARTSVADPLPSPPRRRTVTFQYFSRPPLSSPSQGKLFATKLGWRGERSVCC